MNSHVIVKFNASKSSTWFEQFALKSIYYAIVGTKFFMFISNSWLKAIVITSIVFNNSCR